MEAIKKRSNPAALIRILAVATSACLLLGGCAKDPPTEAKEITITDSGGNVLAKGKNERQLLESEYKDYIEIVYSETLQLLSEQKSCSREDAKAMLFSQQHQVQTAFDPNAHKALETIRTGTESSYPVGGAVTDLRGNLLAVISIDPSGAAQNYALEKNAPLSTLTPLSVYAPALETGLVNWSSLYEDSPYKEAEETDSSQKQPTYNPGNTSAKNVPISDALRRSLSTVAVKCLQDLGAKESVAFLQEKLGFSLTEELLKAETGNEVAALEIIALGQTKTGVTPVDMAGYYQIFANGGIYTAPRSVISITDEAGNDLYTQNAGGKQAIKPETADIMNKLLQKDALQISSGEQADAKIETAGIAGAGDGDNWFAGVTPEYSLALWHGEADSNEASTLFASVVQALYDAKPTANKLFISHAALQETVYCEKSGKTYSPDCTSIQVGYYTNEEALSVCDQCGKEDGTK